MIRFACPGCASTFSVEDAKASKPGKCPKCQTQFYIPDPKLVKNANPNEPLLATLEPPAAPPPPPTPPPPVDGIEVEPCPKCAKRIFVTSWDLGNDVACPYCQTIFKALKPGMRPPASPAAPSTKSKSDSDDPVRTARRDDADDDAVKIVPGRGKGELLTVNYIRVLAAGKVCALVFLVAALLSVAFACVFTVIGLGEYVWVPPSGPEKKSIETIVGGLLISGTVRALIALLFGFVFGVTLASLYNLVVGSMGGLDYESVQAKRPAPRRAAEPDQV